MNITTKFSVGDAVRITRPINHYNASGDGDPGIVSGVHAHAFERGLEVRYSVRIDESVIPRLIEENCTIRVFHLREDDLAPVKEKPIWNDPDEWADLTD